MPESFATIYPDHPNHPLHLGAMNRETTTTRQADVSMPGPRFSPYHASQTKAFDESNFMPTQLEDISKQHDDVDHRVIDSPKHQIVDPHTAEMSMSTPGTSEGNKPQSSQATPIETVGNNEEK
jgi:hypothetical protein